MHAPLQATGVPATLTKPTSAAPQATNKASVQTVLRGQTVLCQCEHGSTAESLPAGQSLTASSKQPYKQHSVGHNLNMCAQGHP